MAKKITNEVEAPEVSADKEHIPDIEVQKASNAENAPLWIQQILKSNSHYSSLFIDSHGGCFTPDTPAIIRGKAILYTNPYHKQ